MSPRRADEPPGLGASLTRRQQLRELLRRDAYTFEDLRRALAIPVRLLEEDLQHLQKSAAVGAERLQAEPAACVQCGFRFERRAQLRYSRPGRCPQCKGTRILHTVLRLVPRA
jgi:predicted Zn-ribbon and HTH transcriptional regulator